MSSGLSTLSKSEDWWAVWFGVIIFAVTLGGLITKVPKVGKWTDNPIDAFLKFADGEVTGNILLSLLVLMIALGVLTAIGIAFMKVANPGRYFAGFVGVFVLACLSYWIANQVNIRYWGLSYALWALLVGLVISNTVGTPKWLRAGAQTELFIKTGLVLMGAEVLFGKIISLGPPGLMVAWVVTPIVVVFMFQYGKRRLKMTNLHLVIIIAAATSVCGVSAAIATACRRRSTAMMSPRVMRRDTLSGM